MMINIVEDNGKHNGTQVISTDRSIKSIEIYDNVLKIIHHNVNGEYGGITHTFFAYAPGNQKYRVKIS